MNHICINIFFLLNKKEIIMDILKEFDLKIQDIMLISL
jgi:hypothetical protein